MNASRETALQRAIRTLLTALARLALKRGMAWADMAELLKQSYVEAARESFSVEGKKTSISRIAVLTGLTRKEASRLVSAARAGEGSDRQRINRAARVLAAWVREPAFLDAEGQPAGLPFDGPDEHCVRELVRRHGGDVPPRAVLDELIRVGAVRREDDGLYHPAERSYVPQSDEAEKIAILGTDVADLISAIDHNLSPDVQEPFFQRKVAYDNLPPDFMPKLKALLRRDGQSLIERLDAEMARYDLDLNPPLESDDATGARRAMIGIYYYEEPRDDERED